VLAEAVIEVAATVATAAPDAAATAPTMTDRMVLMLYSSLR
jgi:hypothetical protein